MTLVHFWLCGAGMAGGDFCWLFMVTVMTACHEVTDGSSLSSWDASSWGHFFSFMWFSHFPPNPH